MLNGSRPGISDDEYSSITFETKADHENNCPDNPMVKLRSAENTTELTNSKMTSQMMKRAEKTMNSEIQHQSNAHPNGQLVEEEDDDGDGEEKSTHQLCQDIGLGGTLTRDALYAMGYRKVAQVCWHCLHNCVAVYPSTTGVSGLHPYQPLTVASQRESQQPHTNSSRLPSGEIHA